MMKRTHLIFDLGGTLIFDPFDECISRLSRAPLRERIEAGLFPEVVSDFLERWKTENSDYNFAYASHFLQEEIWITRAARFAYDQGSVISKKFFPIWTTDLLSIYRSIAVDVISNQVHLPDLRIALNTARARGYMLSVASNDRFFATSAMLSAAGILDEFEFVATSEGLSFSSPGAEKPSRTFFDALQSAIGFDFNESRTFYIGDDETRDILATRELPMKSVRFFGNPTISKSWLDNRSITQADYRFSTYQEFTDLIVSGTFES